MRISDWSSDVCSSDLADEHQPRSPIEQPLPVRGRQPAGELRAPQRIDALPAEFDGDEARYQYAQLHRKGPAGIDEMRKQRGREDDELGIDEEIGRPSGGDRVCEDMVITVVTVYI